MLQHVSWASDSFLLARASERRNFSISSGCSNLLQWSGASADTAVPHWHFLLGCRKRTKWHGKSSVGRNGKLLLQWRSRWLLPMRQKLRQMLKRQQPRSLCATDSVQLLPHQGVTHHHQRRGINHVVFSVSDQLLLYWAAVSPGLDRKLSPSAATYPNDDDAATITYVLGCT